MLTQEILNTVFICKIIIVCNIDLSYHKMDFVIKGILKICSACYKRIKSH
jgi:hypothetical protein